MYLGRVLFAAAMLALALPAVAAAEQPPGPPPKQPKSGHQLFLPSAQENRSLDEVRLPMYRGTDINGDTVRFVVTDASSREWAERFGANFAPKLANAIDTDAVMHVSWGPSGPAFPFTADFGPERVVIPGSPGRRDCPPGTTPSRIVDDLPVDCSAPGATGANGFGLGTATGSNSYSPLIQIATPDGPVVLNAPHIANSTGQGDKVIRLEGKTKRVGHVVYVLTAGLHDGRTIHYVSFDSSIGILAPLEGVTFAPALNRTPSTPLNETVAGTARSGLTIVTNGPTGLGNPERQGVNSAIFDGASTPLNIIQFTPDDVDAGGQTLYSPLWDIHLATWKPGFDPVRLDDFEALLTDPRLEAADGAAVVHPVVFWIVNCPIVSADAEGTFVVPPPT